MPDPSPEQLLRDIVADLVLRSGFAISGEEINTVEFVDFGLKHLLVEGLAIITLFATERLSMKVLVQLPGQTEPEHWHPPVGDDPGKEEVLRTLWGDLFVYTNGEQNSCCIPIPAGKEAVYRCRHEILLRPGQQIQLPAGAPHWFRAGSHGAVFLSISTCARDSRDGFTDPAVQRSASTTFPSMDAWNNYIRTMVHGCLQPTLGEIETTRRCTYPSETNHSNS